MTRSHLRMRRKALQNLVEYDPYSNRKDTLLTSYFETFVHMFKSTFGAGVLAMPKAFAKCGMFIALPCLLFESFIFCYGAHVLLRTQYYLCKRKKVPVLLYGETVEIVLADGPSCCVKASRCSKHLIHCLCVSHQIAICCVYIIFVARSIQSIVEISTAAKITIEFYVLILYLPFVLISLVTSLKATVPITATANLLAVITICVMFYVIFRHLPKLGNLLEGHSFAQVPAFFCSTFFSMNAISVVLLLESNMYNPRRFVSRFGVLNVSMAAACILCALIGFFGNWLYSNNIEENMLNNMDNKSTSQIITMTLYAISIYMSYGLQLIPCTILLTEYTSKCQKIIDAGFKDYAEMLIRIACITFTAIAAIVIVASMSRFMNVVGSFFVSILGIMVPAVLEIFARWPEKQYGRFKHILFLDILLFLVGLLVLLFGIYTALDGTFLENYLI